LIGVFGGSFNPVHSGHLLLAEYIREEFKLDKIVFIPAKKPPHKVDSDLATAQHRYNMVQIAISNNPFFEVSDTELNREGLSYTADTLVEMREENPDKKFFFICGADSIINLSTWHNVNEIFKFADVIAAGRAEASDIEFQNMIQWYQEQYNAKIFCSGAPLIEISSTGVRNRIKEGKSIRYMVPEMVYNYIQLHRLY